MDSMTESLVSNARKLSDAAWRGTHPLEVLEMVGPMTAVLSMVQVDAVRDARTDGASWEAIGEAMGTTRQGAWNFARRWLDQRLPLEQPDRDLNP